MPIIVILALIAVLLMAILASHGFLSRWLAAVCVVAVLAGCGLGSGTENVPAPAASSAIDSIVANEAKADDKTVEPERIFGYPGPEYKPPPSPPPPPPPPPVHAAVKVNDLDAVRRLLGDGHDIERRDADGKTALHLAARGGNVSVVIGLLALGANIEALSKNLWTPLHLAAGRGRVQVIAALLNRGANIEARTKALVYSDALPVGSETPLHIAAESGSYEAVAALLDGGANIEAQDVLNFTPLHVAAGQGKRKIAVELVKRGANVNAVNKMGATPIEYAIEEERFTLADELQKAAQQARVIPQEKPKVVFPTAETGAGKVFESIWRSVVVIETGGGQGSGVALKPNLVATNCHVTDAATSPIAVFKGENRRADKSQSHPARVVAGDRKRDVCLLEVSGLWAIPAETRKAAEMKIAEQVYAVGAPKGLDFSISGGLVSQLRGEDAEGNALVGSAPLIQTDTAISPGSSGGGLFDAQGKLVGLTTFGYRDSEGLNFAVPIEWAMELVPAE